MFHDHYPARGRKQITIPVFLRKKDMFHDHYPARGRKRTVHCSLQAILEQFHDHYPSRGRKQQQRYLRLEESKVSRPLPRKGTETGMSIRLRYQIQLAFHDHYPSRGRKPRSRKKRRQFDRSNQIYSTGKIHKYQKCFFLLPFSFFLKHPSRQL